MSTRQTVCTREPLHLNKRRRSRRLQRHAWLPLTRARLTPGWVFALAHSLISGVLLAWLARFDLCPAYSAALPIQLGWASFFADEHRWLTPGWVFALAHSLISGVLLAWLASFDLCPAYSAALPIQLGWASFFADEHRWSDQVESGLCRSGVLLIKQC